MSSDAAWKAFLDGLQNNDSAAMNQALQSMARSLIRR